MDTRYRLSHLNFQLILLFLVSFSLCKTYNRTKALWKVHQCCQWIPSRELGPLPKDQFSGRWRLVLTYSHTHIVRLCQIIETNVFALYSFCVYDRIIVLTCLIVYTVLCLAEQSYQCCLIMHLAFPVLIFVTIIDFTLRCNALKHTVSALDFSPVPHLCVSACVFSIDHRRPPGVRKGVALDGAVFEALPYSPE